MPITENADKLLFLIKTKGPQTAQFLAKILKMTSMGARQHLQMLQKQNLVDCFDSVDGVGRPKRYWKLTEKAHQRFPDTHSHLTVELIGSIQNLFGESGMEKIISEREKQMQKKYKSALQKCKNLNDKIRVLSQLRTQEGYMAEYQCNQDGSYLLLENHCPICAAASQCQRFCQSELTLFQTVLGSNVEIERESHILSGARRCAYRIKNSS